MQEKITIEGQFRKGSPIKVYIDGVILEPEEWQHITVTTPEKPLQQPTFSVGMRVEFIAEDHIYRFKIQNKFTKNMVYRIAGYSCHSFYIIDDNGIGAEVSEDAISDFFTPYEKPKEGEDYWIINEYEDDCISNMSYWMDDEEENRQWDLGLAFKEKKQAEFARERLSKLF